VAASNDVVIEDSSLRLSAVRGSVRGTRLASFDPPRAGGTGFRLAGDLAGEARNPDRTLGCGSAQVRGWRLRGGRGAVRGSRWRVCGKESDIERGAAVSVERGHAIIANLGSVSNSVGQRGYESLDTYGSILWSLRTQQDSSTCRSGYWRPQDPPSSCWVDSRLGPHSSRRFHRQQESVEPIS
jgi:hypothetical protein